MTDKNVNIEVHHVTRAGRSRQYLREVEERNRGEM